MLARAADRVLLVVLGVSVAYLAFARPVAGLLDPFAPRSVPALVVAALSLPIAVLGYRATSAGSAWRQVVGRSLLIAVTTVVGAMTVDRIDLRLRDAQDVDHWPPRPHEIRGRTVDALEPRDRAMWAARVAAHGLTSRPRRDEIVIPQSWPFPADVTVGTRRSEDGRLEAWARTKDGVASCVSIGLGDGTPATAQAADRCEDARTAPHAIRFVAVRRVASPSPNQATTGAEPRSVGAAWNQYRRDAAHSAAAPSAPASSSGWRTRIDGPIRSSVSVVGDIVLAGAHGTGTLAALDLTTGSTRWSVRVPNWIHQDPVSDGRIVAVGFGDNARSFSNRAPSGVAAYELATGRHLWTAFDEGSVMTAPVIRDSVLVYGTGSGLLRKRRLATGALLGERQLPGAVTMAPPASVGDTIVFTLDHEFVCSLRISTLETRWCRRFRSLRMLGHAAPTIDGDRVLVTGAASLFSLGRGDLRMLSKEEMLRLARTSLFPSRYEAHSGQVFLSLRLADGDVAWRSPHFGNPREAGGHLAGTAVMRDGIGFIVLPISDTLVAFDRGSGAVRWTRDGREARGPVLVVNDRIIRGGRDGRVSVLDPRTGRTLCEERRPNGFDRAGPVLAGGLLLFGTLDGHVEAIPADRYLQCDGEPVVAFRPGRAGGS